MLLLGKPETETGCSFTVYNALCKVSHQHKGNIMPALFNGNSILFLFLFSLFFPPFASS